MSDSVPTGKMEFSHKIFVVNAFPMPDHRSQLYSNRIADYYYYYYCVSLPLYPFLGRSIYRPAFGFAWRAGLNSFPTKTFSVPVIYKFIDMYKFHN